VAYFSASPVHIEAPPDGLSNHSWRHEVRSYFRCKRCATVTHYKYRKKGHGYPVAVNATSFEPALLLGARVRRLDGAATWRWTYERQPHAPW